MRKYIFLFLTSLSFSALNLVFSQQNLPVQMADTMRSNGKIYVVVAVIVTLFIGIVAYLITLDKKIAKLEKETNNG
jgi:ABC-type spermidine/putrescine transport system permease subunit II